MLRRVIHVQGFRNGSERGRKLDRLLMDSWRVLVLASFVVFMAFDSVKTQHILLLLFQEPLVVENRL